MLNATKNRTPGRCPKCGKHVRIISATESDINMPGLDCTFCDWSEVYDIPTDEPEDYRLQG